jgi:capsular exopolysaccharide synthesis family protein
VEGVSGTPSVGGYDPYFIQTEFNIIQSEVVLGKVVEAMNLNEEWGNKYNARQKLKTSETISLLKRNLDLQPVRNTTLIDIRVFSEKPEEAMNLANKIAEVYKQYRLEQGREVTTGGIKSLIQQREEQEQIVSEAQDKVAQLRKDLQIPDQVANADGPSSLYTSEMFSRAMAQRAEGKADLDKLESLLNSLKAMSPDQLKKAVPRAIQDSELSELLSQLNIAEQLLIKLKKDYSPDHPTYIAAQASADDLTRKVNGAIEGTLLGLQAKVNSTRAYVESLDQQVEEAKQKDISTAEKSAPYFESKRKLERLQRDLQLLNARIFSIKTDVELPHTRMVQIVDHATLNAKPVRPNKTLNITLGIVIGLVVGVGLAFFIEYLDTSVKTIDDVERTLQSPVLGVIPQNVGLILNEGAESPHAEAYRVLRTNLLFSRKDDKLNTIVVVSAGAGEGKSTTIFNLATIFAQNGSRVILVDSDLRRPTLHKMIQVTNNLGLTNYLLKQNTLEEVIQTTTQPSLDLLASGKLPSSSLGILSSAQMKSLISELKQRYDYVFFDSPPIMGVSDASVLASEVDMTIQVIQYRRYPQPMNVRAKQMIEKVGGNLVGIVLNNINMSQDESYYYYSGYYHDYYYSRNEDQIPGKEVPAGDKSKLDIKRKF